VVKCNLLILFVLSPPGKVRNTTANPVALLRDGKGRRKQVQKEQFHQVFFIAPS
jgi:hypothetical protein